MPETPPPNKNKSNHLSAGDNPFKPMSAANTNAAAGPQKRSLSAVMIFVASGTALLSIATDIGIQDAAWSTAIYDVLFGLLLAIAISAIPTPELLWRAKYWQAIRWFIFFNALAYIVPIKFLWFPSVYSHALFALPLIFVYAVERYRYRRRPTN